MRSAAIVGLVMVVACMDSPSAAPVQASPRADATPAEATPAEATPAEAPPEIPELSEEDKRLIAADPNDLSPEDRRKRAYAMRRKIMQNPDSPAARTIRDMEEAVRNGEIEPPNVKKEYPTLSLPGTTPKSGKPPAGHRPREGADAPEAPQG